MLATQRNSMEKHGGNGKFISFKKHTDSGLMDSSNFGDIEIITFLYDCNRDGWPYLMIWDNLSNLILLNKQLLSIFKTISKRIFMINILTQSIQFLLLILFSFQRNHST